MPKKAPSVDRIKSDFVRIMTAPGHMGEAEANLIFDQIFDLYSGSNRHYHNFIHIIELYEHADDLQWGFENPDAVRMAILLHDIIYKPEHYAPSYTGKSNEELSADFAKELFDRAGCDTDFTKRVVDLIHMTEKHEPFEEDDPDALLFLDMDMAIIGSDDIRYQEYAVGTAKEFLEAFSDKKYQHGQTAFLQATTQKNRIFHTDYFEERFAATARSNAQNEAETLGNIIKTAKATPSITGLYAPPSKHRN